jgi:7-cyano-7-deazaguanine reductase
MPLGRRVKPPSGRDPSVLFRIPRRPCAVPAFGYDLWRCYELYWLNGNGRPQAGILELAYPASTGFIVESKSLKLYLSGISSERFESGPALEKALTEDLERAIEPDWISVRAASPREFPSFAPLERIPAECLDTMNMSMDPSSALDPGLLSCGDARVEESLYSDLLRTVCPVTGQPDFATVLIRYDGRAMDREGLLRYLCSYRGHRGFSEDVCTRIYEDISVRCTPDRLFVTCLYTRRGGIDITASRCTEAKGPGGLERIRLIRQ